MTASANRFSPFHAQLEYQQPLFPTQESELSVLSIITFTIAPATEDHQGGNSENSAAEQLAATGFWRLTTPQVGKFGSSKYIPLRTESKKPCPNYIGPFQIESLMNPITVCLKLPRKVHNVFNVSLLLSTLRFQGCNL